MRLTKLAFRHECFPGVIAQNPYVGSGPPTTVGRVCFFCLGIHCSVYCLWTDTAPFWRVRLKIPTHHKHSRVFLIKQPHEEHSISSWLFQHALCNSPETRIFYLTRTWCFSLHLRLLGRYRYRISALVFHCPHLKVISGCLWIIQINNRWYLTRININTWRTPDFSATIAKMAGG